MKLVKVAAVVVAAGMLGVVGAGAASAAEPVKKVSTPLKKVIVQPHERLR